MAYSAGADSTALLLAAQARWPGRVEAIHIHHGLQAAADGFERLAREVCRQRGVGLTVCRIQVTQQVGQSPEDAARRARYAALAQAARELGVDVVLLGQHADDQVESVLLALSRGAGLAGLAGMAPWFERDGMAFGRPLLEVTSLSLRNWLLSQDQAFADDPTNSDPRFTRNRIRHQLAPAWQSCFPSYRQALARSARHAAQAQSLLDELAQGDLLHTGEPPAIAALQSLSRARQANALRLWLRRCAGQAPSAAQLDELLDQIDACRTRGHRLHIRVVAGHVVRDAGRLCYTPSI